MAFVREDLPFDPDDLTDNRPKRTPLPLLSALSFLLSAAAVVSVPLLWIPALYIAGFGHRRKEEPAKYAVLCSILALVVAMFAKPLLASL
ncbi:hypothetical protein [Nocardia sp. NPDC057668]|uniref:hypothetical protein n=1 Tax=Nocardia sp. NPDC057668 TaxID=3346202 RepID=UPI00366A7AC5